MTTLLIDGDTTVYKFAVGLQNDIDWGEGVTSHSADLRAACELLDQHVAELSKKFDYADVVIALSDPKVNWRSAILPSYKENRRDFVRPVIWSALRAHIEKAFRCYLRPTLEGDDILGILMTHPMVIPDHKVIVGIDKDLKTIPGDHFNPTTNAHLTVTEPVADWNHLYQTLVGDPIDNYKGCPYVGPVKAARLLGDPSTFSVAKGWPAVVAAFEGRGLTEADALQQAQVARICRASDFDFHNRRPIPWTPSR